MIQEQTMLNIISDLGARRAMCIEVLGSPHRRYAGVGDITKITIREAIPRGKVKKGDVLKVVVVHTKKGVRHPNGSITHFNGNACVLLNDNGEQPIGTCILGSVTCEPCNEEFMKIISLAPGTL